MAARGEGSASRWWDIEAHQRTGSRSKPRFNVASRREGSNERPATKTERARARLPGYSAPPKPMPRSHGCRATVLADGVDRSVRDARSDRHDAKEPRSAIPATAAVKASTRQSKMCVEEHRVRRVES